MTAYLPASSTLSTLELLAGRVVPVTFDGSAVVEGTVRPTTASSPDAVVCGILSARLEEAKDLHMYINKLGKLLDCNQLTTYLLLVACEELLRLLTTDRAPFGCPAWVSALGAGLCSLSLFSPAASSSAQPRSDISTDYIRIHVNILGHDGQYKSARRKKKDNYMPGNGGLLLKRSTSSYKRHKILSRSQQGKVFDYYKIDYSYQYLFRRICSRKSIRNNRYFLYIP